MSYTNLKKEYGVSYILTSSNPKTDKSVKYGYYTVICHFAPAKLNGQVNICESASPACLKTCLNTAGRGFMPKSVIARKNRTLFYLNHKVEFMIQLDIELKRAERKAKKLGLKLAVRLNGTSDLPDFAIEVARKYEKIKFYDYSAHKSTLFETLPENYYVTFSRKENNTFAVHTALERGYNVSVLFASMVKDTKAHTRTVPQEYLGYPVIDGDKHDLRFLDPKGVIVGLSPKGNGKIKQDKTGFVVR